MCDCVLFLNCLQHKPHANPTFIYENIKGIHILAVVGILEFPILNHVLLRRGSGYWGVAKDSLLHSHFIMLAHPYSLDPNESHLRFYKVKAIFFFSWFTDPPTQIFAS